MTIHTIYYSPTTTSQRVAGTLARRLSGETGEVLEHDLTPPVAERPRTVVRREDLAVIAVPVYAGRVARPAAERLRAFRGEGTPAVIVVLYGNREYEDALLELYDIAVRQSFRVVAAGAFIGEHSFSSADMPIAHGRPDEDDLARVRQFADTVGRRLAEESGAVCERSSLPGNDPYGEGMGNIPLTPELDAEACTLCGECARHCPAAAISLGERPETDAAVCTFCCACIKICPEGALSIGQGGPVADKKRWLHRHCEARKEPELFL